MTEHHGSISTGQILWTWRGGNALSLKKIAKSMQSHCDGWNCISPVGNRPSITRPIVGGVVSIVTPLETPSEHNLRELQARTVTKYLSPGDKTKPE